jgi:hypothetical protein
MRYEGQNSPLAERGAMIFRRLSLSDIVEEAHAGLNAPLYGGRENSTLWHLE